MSLINPENWAETGGDAKSKRWEYWGLIYKARRDFVSQIPPSYDLADVNHIPHSFEAHMRDEYGIAMSKDPDGNYTADFSIIDEHKYLLFKLKYS